MSIADYGIKIKSVFHQHENELILIVAVVLAGGLGFGLGRWSQLSTKPALLEIQNVPSPASATTPVGESRQFSLPVPASAGKFVASKNGTKYYLPSCAGASRIKTENKIWFNSAVEAQARGLTPAANCPGL